MNVFFISNESDNIHFVIKCLWLKQLYDFFWQTYDTSPQISIKQYTETTWLCCNMFKKRKNNLHLFYMRALRHCTWKKYKFALYSLWCFQRMAEVQQREFFEIEGPKSDVAYPLKVRYCGGIRLFIVLRILMLSYKYIMIYKYIKYLLY